MGDNPQGETKTISTHLNPPSQGGFEVYMSLRGAKRHNNLKKLILKFHEKYVKIIICI